MARRPKRTYNQETGQWEVEKLWDSRDDQGRYWKNGVQVDSSGRPWQETEDELKEYYASGGEQTSTPGTGVDGGPLPEVGDQTIDQDDPRNLVTVGSDIMPYSEAQSLLTGGNRKAASRSASSDPAGKSGALRRALPKFKRL